MESRWAVWRTYTACCIVESLSAFRIPQSSPFLTTFRMMAVALFMFPNYIACSSTVRTWLEAVNTCISIARWASSPANWTYSMISISTLWVAKSSVFIFTCSAISNYFTSTPSVWVFPASLSRNASDQSDYYSCSSFSHEFQNYLLNKVIKLDI